MKRIVLIFLCIALITGCMICADGAVRPRLQYGDADQDNEVTILDATKIQRYLVDIEKPDELALALSDADGDGEMSVLDATAIQRELADIPGTFCERYLYDYYIGEYTCHSTAEIRDKVAGAEQDICYVGVPVTFTTKIKWGAKPQYYRFSVNDEVVDEAEAKGYDAQSFDHTFMEEGEYNVTTRVECQYGAVGNYTRKVKVVSLTDKEKPIIMGAAFFDQSWMNSGKGRLTVTAIGGTEPYEYSYEVRYEADDDYDFDAPSGAIRGYDTGFIGKNEITIDDSSVYTFATVRVKVRDKNGVESDPVIVRFANYSYAL